MQNVAKLVNDQQRAMVWALLAVRRLTNRAHASVTPPDFPQLKRLTRYVERFSENLHQRNEERFLLSPVEARQPALARTVRRLRREHSAMQGYGNRLRTALNYWEKGDPNAGPLAAAVAVDYALRLTGWADPRRLVLAGTSEGATTVARNGDEAFAARLIYSWSCEDNYFVEAHRTEVIADQPVLNVISSVDPFFSPGNSWLGNHAAKGHCWRLLPRPNGEPSYLCRGHRIHSSTCRLYAP